MTARDDLVAELERTAGKVGQAGDPEMESLLRRASSMIAVLRHPSDDLNLTFQQATEPVSGEPAGDNLASACVIRSAIIDARHLGVGRIPVLAHTFYAADGLTVLCEPHLVLEPSGMRAYRTLVGQSVDAALNLARKGHR